MGERLWAKTTALIDSFVRSETTPDLSGMQLKLLSLYMEQRTSVLLSSHQGVTRLIWLIMVLKCTKQSRVMNIFLTIERISELNYTVSNDKVTQLISGSTYYLVRCKGKNKGSFNHRNVSLERISWVALYPERDPVVWVQHHLKCLLCYPPSSLKEGPSTTLLLAPVNLRLICTSLLSPQCQLLA